MNPSQRLLVLSLFLLVLSGEFSASSFGMPSPIRYRVKRGDQLGVLLDRLGVCPLWGDTGSVAIVIAENHKTDGNLQPGEEIILPPPHLFPKSVHFEKDLLIYDDDAPSMCSRERLKQRKRKKRSLPEMAN